MDSSYLKIFRPWDLGSKNSKKEEQDSTISTTTTEDNFDTKENEKSDSCAPVKKENISDFSKVKYCGSFERCFPSKGLTINQFPIKNNCDIPQTALEQLKNFALPSQEEITHISVKKPNFSADPITQIEVPTKKSSAIPSIQTILPKVQLESNKHLNFQIIPQSGEKRPHRPMKEKHGKKMGNLDKTEGKHVPSLVGEVPHQYYQDTSLIPDFPMGPVDYNLYPEILHANLAQSLGLTSQDSMFIEHLSQGYAMEEYARILSQEQQSKFLNGKKQRPKKYKCPHCDVGFSNNGQLKGHIRIHTGERPFKCEEENCGKTFTRNEELTRHKRIHSGLRPFPCQQCGKRFGRKDHLKKHTRTHFQNRGVYAVPIMLPLEAWSGSTYPYVPLYGY